MVEREQGAIHGRTDHKVIVLRQWHLVARGRFTKIARLVELKANSICSAVCFTYQYRGNEIDHEILQPADSRFISNIQAFWCMMIFNLA